MKVSVEIPDRYVDVLKSRAANLGWSLNRYVAGLCIAEAQGKIKILRPGEQKAQTYQDLLELKILLS